MFPGLLNLQTKNLRIIRVVTVPSSTNHLSLPPLPLSLSLQTHRHNKSDVPKCLLLVQPIKSVCVRLGEPSHFFRSSYFLGARRQVADRARALLRCTGRPAGGCAPARAKTGGHSSSYFFSRCLPSEKMSRDYGPLENEYSSSVLLQPTY